MGGAGTVTIRGPAKHNHPEFFKWGLSRTSRAKGGDIPLLALRSGEAAHLRMALATEYLRKTSQAVSEQLRRPLANTKGSPRLPG